MKSVTQATRLFFIVYVFLKHGVDDLLRSLPFFKILRAISWFWWPLRKNPSSPRGQRIRHALEELGPVFVKFGQLLSTRLDILPEDIALEFIRLQDKVPPFSSEISVKMIQEALGQPINSLFREFETIPLASASIAQVHGAVLHDGSQVVLKVLRPDIGKIIKRDAKLLYTLAQVAEKCWSPAKQLRLTAVVLELEKTLMDEVDLLREAANASQLRRNFSTSCLLQVPYIYWPLTRINVLVMERVFGIPVSNKEELIAQGVNFQKLAERSVEIFLTQVFRDCFFHADMHPGNIMIDAREPNSPIFIAVDFGIMGSLGPSEHRYLAQNFMAFFKRDYRRVAELHVESGWVPAETRVEEFESAIRTVCEPLFERPLKEISFGKTLLRLFQTARRFNMHIQPQLILLQKTLINVEGLGRQLYPDLDLWKTAKPILEEWMQNQTGLNALWRKMRDQAPYWVEKLPELPPLLHHLLQQKAAAHKDSTPVMMPTRALSFTQGLIFGVILTTALVLLLDKFWNSGFKFFNISS